MTKLRYCRCQDCEKLTREDGCWWRCAAGIGGTRYDPATVKHETVPHVAEWHYCRGYRGPILSDETMEAPCSEAKAAQDALFGP